MLAHRIAISNLRKAYGTSGPVLDIKELVFSAGEVICILGSTGCGKTTLLNVLSNVDPDYDGQIAREGAHELRVSYQPQRDLLLPWKSVRDNLLLGFLATNSQPPDELVRSWLWRLDLDGVAGSYPAALSTGMRQRVALGRALIWSGNLILLDEPLSAQDIVRRLSLEALLRVELRKPDVVGIVVTHNLEEAVVLADRIVVLGGVPARVLDDFEVSGFDEVDRPVSARRSTMFGAYVAKAAQALSSAVQLT